MKRRLNAEQIEGIRQRLWNGEPPGMIAKDYGVDKTLVSQIKCGITYDDLDRAEWLPLAEIAKRYNTGPDRIKNMATLAGHEVRTHHNKRYIPVACIERLIDPFFTQEWIPITVCSKHYGPTVSILKGLVEKHVLPALVCGPYWYLEKSAVETYLEPTHRLITLAEAAKQMKCSRERLRQLKDQERITVTPIGGRFYVDIDQLREELKSQDLLQEEGKLESQHEH